MPATSAQSGSGSAGVGSDRAGVDRVVLAFLGAIALLMYWRAAGVFFAVDDFVFLIRYKTLSWPGVVPALAGRYLSHDVAFFIHQQLFGSWHVPYHLLSVSLHVVNGYLVFSLLKALDAAAVTHARVSAVLFVLHPAAYTILSWTVLGYEETVTLALSLAAVWLFLRYLDRPHSWRIAVALLLVVVASGFKNHAILAPMYMAAFGILRLQSHGGGLRRVTRVVTALAPFACFDLWYLLVVMPGLPQAQHQAYTQDFSAVSLAGSYFRLLPNTFNVVPFVREALGYQEAVPAGLGASLGDVRWYRAAVIALAVAGIGYGGYKTRRLLFTGVMSAVVLLGLFFAASLPRHLYEYYTYFSLPAACALIGLPVALGIDAGRRRVAGARWPVERIAITLLLAYALAAGTVAHRSNGLVRQAEHAELVHRFTTGAVRPGQTLEFVPPSERARLDTVNGLLLEALHAEAGLRAVFRDSGEAQAACVASDSIVRVALDAVGQRGFQVYPLDQVQWSAAGKLRLRSGEEVRQRFRASAADVAELHVLVGAPAMPPGAALFAVTIHEVGSGLETAGSGHDAVQAPGEVVIRAAPMPRDGFYQEGYVPIPMPVDRPSAGRMFELRIRGLQGAERGATLFYGTRTPADCFPLRVEALNGSPADAGPGEPRVLAFRVARAAR